MEAKGREKERLNTRKKYYGGREVSSVIRRPNCTRGVKRPDDRKAKEEGTKKKGRVISKGGLFGL